MFNHVTHCAGDTAIFDSAAAFLREQGRMKYLRPLYKALAGSGAQGKALAQVNKTNASSSSPTQNKWISADIW